MYFFRGAFRQFCDAFPTHAFLLMCFRTSVPIRTECECRNRCSNKLPTGWALLYRTSPGMVSWLFVLWLLCSSSALAHVWLYDVNGRPLDRFDRRLDETGTATGAAAASATPFHRTHWLRTNTRDLAALAAFAADGMTIVCSSFNLGYREWAAVSELTDNAVTISKHTDAWPHTDAHGPSHSRMAMHAHAYACARHAWRAHLHSCV